MNNIQIETTIAELYNDSKKDYIRIMKGAAKSIFGPTKPSDFKNAYLSISLEQGKELINLIKENDIKNIVEFGTSFGISTLFLAQGARQTGGNIITTELIESKAQKAQVNFQNAGVDDIIDVRIGDALDTLKNHNQSIDLLLLDGWKDLYLPLFQMLKPNFLRDTIIYVDNADMRESKEFLKVVSLDTKYKIEYFHKDKVAMISIRK